MYYLEEKSDAAKYTKAGEKYRKSINRDRKMNGKGRIINRSVSTSVTGVAGLSAAALLLKSKKYARAAAKAKAAGKVRDARIYAAKADRFKKLAIAAGATAGVGAVATTNAWFGKKIGEKRREGFKRTRSEIDAKESRRQADGTLAESIFLEGYYDALEEYGCLD